MNIIIMIATVAMIGYYSYYLVVQKNIGGALLQNKQSVAMADITQLTTQQTVNQNITLVVANAQGVLSPSTVTLTLPQNYQEEDLLKGVVTAYITQSNGWVDPSTQLQNLFIQNGVLYLNLTTGFTSHMDSPQDTATVINGLVNSILQNDSNISQVAFLINGQSSSVIAQNMNNQQFFTGNN